MCIVAWTVGLQSTYHSLNFLICGFEEIEMENDEVTSIGPLIYSREEGN